VENVGIVMTIVPKNIDGRKVGEIKLGREEKISLSPPLRRVRTVQTLCRQSVVSLNVFI
jgi:hypothetical protein